MLNSPSYNEPFFPTSATAFEPVCHASHPPALAPNYADKAALGACLRARLGAAGNLVQRTERGRATGESERGVAANGRADGETHGEADASADTRTDARPDARPHPGTAASPATSAPSARAGTRRGVRPGAASRHGTEFLRR